MLHNTITTMAIEAAAEQGRGTSVPDHGAGRPGVLWSMLQDIELSWTPAGRASRSGLAPGADGSACGPLRLPRRRPSGGCRFRERCCTPSQRHLCAHPPRALCAGARGHPGLQSRGMLKLPGPRCRSGPARRRGEQMAGLACTMGCRRCPRNRSWPNFWRCRHRNRPQHGRSLMPACRVGAGAGAGAVHANIVDRAARTNITMGTCGCITHLFCSAAVRTGMHAAGDCARVTAHPSVKQRRGGGGNKSGRGSTVDCKRRRRHFAHPLPRCGLDPWSSCWSREPRTRRVLPQPCTCGRQRIT
mmetsp:Transcript_55581/g.178321  ORF Transcript_55581/g.178321 Transcript_55581/m.178321 type:complete len:301 (-) Transcript_55581:836-1738(-)